MGIVRTLHIVGYKNSGKTTLLERWIGIVKVQGLSVAVLKHHGHGGKIELPPEETDTQRFFNKGADTTIVAGGGNAELLLASEPSFNELKQLAAFNQPDVLLIEGYKDEQGEKVVLVRSEEDWQTLHRLEGIRLVVGAVLESEGPVIQDRGCSAELDGWFLNWLTEEEHHETI